MERNEPHKNDADLRALFQSKFENEEQVAPEQAWPALEKKLFRKNRFRFYFFGLSGLLIVSTFIGIQLNSTKQTTHNNTEVRTSIIQKQNAENKTSLTITKKQTIQQAATLNNIQQQSLTVRPVSNLEQKNSIGTIQTKQLTIASEALSEEILTSNASNKEENQTKNEQTTINTTQTELENRQLLYLKLTPIMQIACSPANIVQAQRKVQNTKRKQLYYAGVTIGGGIRLQEINGNFNSNHPNTKDLVDRTIPMRNKQIGIETGFQLNQHFALETGIVFNRYTFESNWFKKEIEDKTDNESYEFSTNDGNLKIAAVELNDYFQTANYTLLNVKVNHTSRSWLLPVSVRYDFTSNRFHPFLKLGVSLERIFSNTSILEIEKDGEARNFTFKGNEIIRKNTFSTQIGIGGAYEINSSWRFNAELNYYRAFTKIVETSKMSINTNNIQLKLGFHYIF